MIKFVIIAVLVGCFVFGEKPEFGSQHCTDVLAISCDGYSYEPICGFDGTKQVTYNNSCEFAHGICRHHGHSLHALYDGPCVPATTAMP